MTPQLIAEEQIAESDHIPDDTRRAIWSLLNVDEADVTVHTLEKTGNNLKVNLIVDSGRHSPPAEAQLLLWNHRFMIGHPRDEDGDGFTVRLFRTFDQ